ncbi:MAG: hypothetical protein HKL88_00075 [Bacteroidia bacterium]|jgi:hypothetical protein|nr:hypothetical protein [Bacteroidia bacterium]
MNVYDASGIILRKVHSDLEGKLLWNNFVQEQTRGYNEAAANEIRGVYARALIILIDEGLCRKAPGSDVVELAHKGIEYNGDFKKYLKKKKITVLLEKLRRIAPIVSAIIVIITFIITMIKRNADKQKKAVIKVQAPAKPKKR